MKPFHKSIIGSGNFGKKEEQKIDGVVVVPGPSWVGTIDEASSIGSDQFDALKGFAVSGVLSGATFGVGVDLAAPEGDITSVSVIKDGKSHTVSLADIEDNPAFPKYRELCKSSGIPVNYCDFLRNSGMIDDGEAQFYGGTADIEPMAGCELPEDWKELVFPQSVKPPETKPEAKTTIESLNIEAIHNELEQYVVFRASVALSDGSEHHTTAHQYYSGIEDVAGKADVVAKTLSGVMASQGIDAVVTSIDIERAIARHLAPKPKEKTAYERLRDAVMDAREGDECDLDLAIYINPRFRDALRNDQPIHIEFGFDAVYGIPIYNIDDERHPDFVVVAVP